MLGGGEADREKPAHSLAFERFVSGDDDLVGLIAYALFKQTVRADLSNGTPKSESARFPNEMIVKTFRESAERRIEQFTDGYLLEYQEQLQNGAVAQTVNRLKSNLESVESDLIGYIRTRTGFGMGVLVNFVGWAVTVVLTYLIIVTANTNLAEVIGKGFPGRDSAPERSVPPPRPE